MAAMNSALSLAADAIAAGLGQHLADVAGDKVLVSVDTPLGASNAVKTIPNTYFVNLFFYRVSHSGFHAAQTSRQPLFLRLQCLVTPFSGAFDQNNGDPHRELTLLGEAIRFFHDREIVSQELQNPGPEDAPGAPKTGTRYRLECTLLQPSMEEINHIWTTQGENLSYRLSAAYEFSLIPMEPLRMSGPVAKVRSAMLDVMPSAKIPDPTVFGANLRGIPLANLDADLHPPPVKWLPVVMLRKGATLSNIASVAPATATVDVALAGLPGELAALEMSFFRADGTQSGATGTAFETIRAAVLDDGKAVAALPFARPNDATRLTIRARPGKLVAGAQQIESDAPFTHTLTVTFDGAGP